MAHATGKNTRRAVAIGAALLWMALVLGLYYWVHKPLTPALAEAIGGAILDTAVAILFALLAGGLGMRLLARLDLGFLSPAERLATAMLIGLGALALLILGVGVILLSPLSMAGLFLVVAALVRRGILAWLGEWRAFLHGGLPRDSWARFLAFVCLILLAIAFLLALLPPSMWDVLTYHLAGPAQHVANGRFSAVEHNHFLGFSQLVDTLYAGQLALTGRLTGAAQLHWIIGIGLLLATGGYTARRSGPAAGWAAAAVLLAGRTIWLEMTFAYADLLPVGLAVVAVIAAERWDEVRHERANGRRGLDYLLLVGVAVGLAMSSKYTVVWLGAALGLLVLWLARRDSRRTALAYGLRYGLVAAAILAPWLIRNALWYGNPFYPLLFDGGEMDAIRRAWYSQPGSGLIYRAEAWQLPFLPLAATVLGVEGAGTYNTDIGPLFVMLTPLLLLTWRQLTATERTTVRCALIVAGVVTAAWAFSAAFGSYISLQTRLVLYLFGPLAVVAGIALESLRRLPARPLNLGFVVRALVALVLVFTVGDVLQTLGRKGVQIYFSGEEGYRERYLEHTLGWHDAAMRRVNTLPEGATVRFLWEPRYLYCDGIRLECWPDSLMDGWYYARRAVGDGSPAAIAAMWRETADYLLVYEFGRTFEQERNTLYTAADWAAWEDFAEAYLIEEWRADSDGAGTQYILYRWRD